MGFSKLVEEATAVAFALIMLAICSGSVARLLRAEEVGVDLEGVSGEGGASMVTAMVLLLFMLEIGIFCIFTPLTVVIP